MESGKISRMSGIPDSAALHPSYLLYRIEQSVIRVCEAMIKIFKTGIFEDLSREALSTHRRRAHLNIHDSLDDRVQRLFIALEPDTYIRPHRHPQENKWELFILLQGVVDLLVFDDSGTVIRREHLSADSVRAVELPPNIWHTYVCQTPASIAIEIKEGPYLPTPGEDFAPWAPTEGAAEASAYLAWMRGEKPA